MCFSEVSGTEEADKIFWNLPLVSKLGQNMNIKAREVQLISGEFNIVRPISGESGILSILFKFILLCLPVIFSLIILYFMAK